MLEVPAWANRLVVILLAIGFPVVLLFAWVYEITPEGLKPTVEVDPHRSIRKRTGQRLDRAIMVLLVLGVAYLLVDKLWLSKHVTAVEHEVATSSPATTPVPAISEKSIAVLPFADTAHCCSRYRDVNWAVNHVTVSPAEMPNRATSIRRRLGPRTLSRNGDGARIPSRFIASKTGLSFSLSRT